MSPPRWVKASRGKGPAVKVNIRALYLFKCHSHCYPQPKATGFRYMGEAVRLGRMRFSMIIYSLKFPVIHKGEKKTIGGFEDS